MNFGATTFEVGGKLHLFTPTLTPIYHSQATMNKMLYKPTICSYLISVIMSLISAANCTVDVHVSLVAQNIQIIIF